MKTYAFKELTSATLAEVAIVRHEPRQPAVWDELSRRDVTERERTEVGYIVGRLLQYKIVRVNEATVWARAIYPLLALAEQDDIRAWSAVPFAGRFNDVEIRGEADGALAGSIDEEIGIPYLVVIEAKRGIGASDPMAQVLGAMLCAAQLNERDGQPAREIYGCYTVADIWTFLRGKLEWSEPMPVMTVLSSREYVERTEAQSILSVLISIVGKALGQEAKS